ncbi:hypothetical protein [Mycobacterium sp. D16Q16]|uniref:hypothetical protein n=1 Tax=Mycobacterium sp. D16Q16 TaxID=1855659 RepID=UPI0011177001|nr:hypothetical protein [Mycobacterium sp. D16Q16]
MGIRLLLAPWWARWLVLVAAMTIVAVPLWLLLMPDDGSSWKVRANQAPVFSIATAILLALMQQRFRRSFLAILADLDGPQRRYAIRASQRGDIPSDPAVLSAALRLCDLVVGTRLRAPRWARWFLPGATVLWLVTAIAYFIGHDTRRGVLWLCLSLLVAAGIWWDTYQAQRQQKRLTELREAAGPILGTIPVLAEHEFPPTMPSLKIWLSAVGVLIIVAVGIGIGTYVTGRPYRECRAALKSVTIVLDHEDLLNSEAVLSGGPGLSVFEDWSTHLHDVATRVTRPDVAQRAQHISVLSDNAVLLVHQIRESPGTQEDQNRRRVAYLTLINQILDESGAIQDTCYRH